jgi:hypothetical protein
MALYYTIRRDGGGYVVAWEDNDGPVAPRFCVSYPQHETQANRVAERLNSNPSDMRALAVLAAFMKTPFAIQGSALND